MIDALDADDNGKVTKDEWTKAFGSIYEMMNPDMDKHADALDGMIESKDEAKDDDHPDEELKKIIGDAKNREEAEKNAGDTFDRLDKNKDGSLSVEEILALIDSSDITDEVKKEAETLIDALDADDNGKVTKDEWTKAFGSIYDMLE